MSEMENLGVEQGNKPDEIDLTKAVKGLKGLFNKENPAASVFIILAFISLLLSLVSIINIGLGNNFVGKFTVIFPSWILIFLTLMLFLSYVTARLKKYKLMFLPLILWLLIITVSVRTSNISQLIDVATGEPTLGPDLDPFLYLRHAMEINDRSLENPDSFRYGGSENYAYKNLMPWAIFLIFKIISLFSSTSITYAAIITPVILFLISAIGFLLFTKTIFAFKFSEKKAWVGAIIASLLYVVTPSMLHRTTAGIPEIESLGIVWFWFAFLFFTMAWKSETQKKILVYGLLSGIFTGLMSWTWGGYRYIYMIICLTVLMFFLFQKDNEKNFKIFFAWVIPALILEFLRIGNVFGVITNITDTGFAFFTIFVLGVDWILHKTNLEKTLRLNKFNLPRPIKSAILGIIILVGIFILWKGSFVIETVGNIFERILYPFGRERVGLTVAENKVPYFQEILGNFKYLFWTFALGIWAVFYTATKKFNLNKKIIFNSLFIIMVLGFIFNRYSPTSLFNGDNFISRLFYLGGIILFFVFTLYVIIKAHIKKDEKTLSDFKEIDFSLILLISFAFFTLLSMRGAIRLLFIISPMLPIFSGFLFINLLNYSENGKGTKKLAGVIMSAVVILLLAATFVQYYEITDNSTKSTIPSSYTQQWQKAMSWTRENTPQESTFVHWWDYGYWVQTIGERPTVTDGGHFIGYWDHLIGRYLLTTPFPETALSFMKTHNVSYLLIDSTDLGKYSAYSSIGDDEEVSDRLSWLPVLGLDSRQTQETANSTITVYVGGFTIDKDIIYKQNNENIFLPQGKAGLGGVLLEIKETDIEQEISQPTGVFVYNGQQYNLPIRKLFVNGQIIDFKEGVNSTVIVIPAAEVSQTGNVNINNQGAMIYLSEKTQDSLFAQLYLMNDPSNLYPSISLVHSEDDALVASLKAQGANINDLLYYQGFRGPIKIWDIKYPDEIIEREEFLRTSGNYGEFDDLEFTK